MIKTNRKAQAGELRFGQYSRPKVGNYRVLSFFCGLVVSGKCQRFCQRYVSRK